MRRPALQRIISTRGWNDFVAWWFRQRILQVVPAEPTPWRHPWHTTAEWDAAAETWTARIAPGFCLSPTGEAVPRLTVPETLAGDEALERLGIDVPAPDRTTEVYLDESPRLPLPAAMFRAIGTDATAVSGGATESVPEYFTDRGVLGPQVLDTGREQAVIRIDGLIASRSQARLLRAVDLVLYHDRLATVVAPEITVDEVAWTLSLERPSNYRIGPWIETARSFETAAARAAAAVLLGEAVDPGRDGRLLATVYLLSPPGAAEGSVPDGTWQPHVRHHAYWNLQYRPTYELAAPEPTRVAVPVPQLGLGQLGAAAAIFTEAINRNLAELEAAVRRVENAGVFYMAS